MPPLFQHILLPVDFTEKNRSALAAAVQLSLQNAARVTLLHVIETVDVPPSHELTRFYDGLRRRSERELQVLADDVAAQGVDVAQQTVLDRRVPGIIKFARENEVDLIVMSSHPVGPERRAGGWTTISYQVAALCSCPVMLIKRPEDAEVPPEAAARAQV